MQQLAGLFPGSYYNNDESKALDFMGYFAHQRQQDEAFKNQEINRQGALEDLFQTRQLNPMKLDYQRLQNRTLEEQLPGVTARAGSEKLKLDTETQLQPHIVKQKIQEALKGLTEAELKDEKAQIEKMLIHPFLSAEQRKVFEMLRDNFPENYKLNQTLGSKETIAAMPKPGRATGGGGAPKPPAPPKKLEDLETHYMYQASQANDPEEKARLQALAKDVADRRTAIEVLKAQARAAGGVNLEEYGVPTKPMPSTSGATPKPATTPKTSTGRIVIYKDGKAVGTIPEAQREQAIKQGYSVK